MLNYEEITANIIPDKVLLMMIKLGVRVYDNSHSGYYIFPTVCHNSLADESSNKLYFYKDTKMFYCYTEDGPMTIFTFLKHFYEAQGIHYNWYNDVLKVVMSCTKNGMDTFTKSDIEKYKKIKIRKKRKAAELTPIKTSILDVFIKRPCIEWLNDGITVETMEKFNILYSINQNKIVIPHYDINNELVGIRARSLNEEDILLGKYRPIAIENKLYNHKLSLNLYGLNLNKENIKKNGYVFLFEGEKSVLQLDSFNLPNCAVATCGSNFNKFQLNLLLKYCYPKEIIICYDNEEKKGKDIYYNKLYKMAKNYSNYCNFSFIYDMSGLLDYKDSPTDKGEQVFRTLYNERVKVR